MRTLTLAILTIGLACSAAVDGETTPPASTQEELSTVFPPYLQNPTADGMTICFLAQAADHVRVGWSADDGQALTEVAATGHVIPGTPWTMWRTRLRGLHPGGAYRYEVRCQLHFDGRKLVTPTYHFRTLDPQAKTLRFAVFNDLHHQDKTLAALMRHVKPEDYDFAILLGDCLEASRQTGAAGLLGTWRAYIKLLNGSEKPVIFVRGNHDTRQSFANRLAYLFDLPNLSVKQPWGEDQWQFTMQSGPVWLLAMDTGEDKHGINTDPRTAYKHPAYWESYRQRQAEWLQKVIDSKTGIDASWRVFLSHIPLYNNNQWYCLSGQRLWEPLLRTTRIDLMLAGHDHQWKCLQKDSGRVAPVLIGGGPSLNEGTVMLVTADETTLHARLLAAKDGRLLTEFTADKPPMESQR